jgi:2-dehydropantoate 2-reductase
MRIAIMGAGAVGAYFGARLAAAGHEVGFIARGKHLEAMQRDGLTINSINGDQRIRSFFTADPAALGAADVILFCVKTYDTEVAARQLAPMMGKDTTILTLQNGVDGPQRLAELWGSHRTWAGVVFIAARVERPGVIEHTAAGKIVFGELDGTVGQATRRLHETLSQANIPCEISAEITKVMWQKLVWNAPFCALCCLLQAPVQAILDSESLTALAVRCMEEVREAAACEGIRLDPSIAAQTLRFSRGLGGFKPSMLQDLENGKPLEYQALNGIVRDVLDRHRRQAPVNETLYTLLKFLDQRNRQHASSS